MRLGLFFAMLGRQAGGPETYEANLVRSLLEYDGDNDYHLFFTDSGARREFDAMDFGGGATPHTLWPPVRALGIGLGLPVQMMRNGVDLVHATFIPPPVSPKPYAMTMHDTSMFDHPEFYHPDHLRRLQKLIPIGLRRARMVICISEYTRDMVQAQFGIPPERLHVVYHGVSDRFRVHDKARVRAIVRDNYGLERPYLLFVGQLKTRSKNLLRLLEAFSLVRHEMGGELDLVMVGRRSWASEGLDEAIHRLGIADHVIEPGHVPDEDLPFIYNGSSALVFPSLVEGFGFPVVEAMACGTPVVTSTAYCLPEIAGGAARLVDPHSVESIASGVVDVLRDKDLAAAMRERGLARAGTFTWEAAARGTLDAYERALAS